MIRRHDLNSAWCGAEVGIVDDEAFFELGGEERAAALAPWAWVEARGPLSPEHGRRVARAGFLHVDTQIPFRIGLGRIASSPSVERLDVRSQADAPFTVAADDLADFRHERFLALPGMTQAELNRRYALWSEALCTGDPASCLEILAEGNPQGWFLSRTTEKGLELTLAMLRRDAVITGHHLYHRALIAYREAGTRVGFAAFSVTNTAVHNIYAALGARFLDPVGCWLWSGAR
jgi:hypothetical protein